MTDFVTQPRIMRSLAFATLLALNDMDPEEDFDQVSGLPIQDGRLYFQYEGQKMPLTYGPFGTFLVPGIVVELRQAPNYRGNCLASVIVSLARKIVDGSHERELEHLDQLAQKLRPFIMTTKQCPVYLFAEDAAPAIGYDSYIDWHDEKLGLSPPTEDLVGNTGMTGQRWLRHEMKFTIFYRLDVQNAF